MAIAGIMGGENSEIMEDTTTVLIESANFNMVNIRRSSKRLGLRSESSMRFEKGVNIEGAREAADRAAKLMANLGGGRVASGVVDNYPRKWTPVKIELNVKKVNNLLDLNLSEEKIVDLLGSIDLKSDSIGHDTLLVTVPPFRLDIEREIDLVEEVARLYGYEKIPLTIPEGDVGQQKMTWEQVLERKCKEILTGCGLTEVISFSFLNPKSFDKMGLPEDHSMRKGVEISNPLSEEHSVMRTSLIPNLLEIAQRNVSRKVLDLSIFEFGRVFHPGEETGEPIESPVLSGLVMGSMFGGWKWGKEEFDFFFLKGVLEELMDRLNIKDTKWEPCSFPGLHPGRSARLIREIKYLAFWAKCTLSVGEL